MASKSLQRANASVEETEELLDAIDKNLDRLKTLYEQYFLGIQKQAPGPLHADVERKIRDLIQVQLRNTAHRYRFATLQQKFSSYNAYWRRTVRQIENGTYIRNLSKIGRNAARTGEAIPEEILQAMPKRMREQVIRDRESALAQARRRGQISEDVPIDTDDLLELGAEDFVGEESALHPPGHADAPMELSEDAFADAIALIKEPTDLRRQVKNQRGAHKVSDDDGELDINAFFASVEAQDEPPKPSDSVRFRSVTRASVAPPTTDGGEPQIVVAKQPTRPPATAASASASGIRGFAKTANPHALATSPGIGPAGRQPAPTQPPLTTAPVAPPQPLGAPLAPKVMPVRPVMPVMPIQRPTPAVGTPAVQQRLTPGGGLPAVPGIPGIPAIPGMPGRGLQPKPAQPAQPAPAPTQRPSQPMQAQPTPQPAQRQGPPHQRAQTPLPTRDSRPIPVQVGRDTPPDGFTAMTTPQPAKRPSRQHPVTEQTPPPAAAVAPAAPVAPTRPTPARQRPSNTDVDPPARATPPPGMTEGDVNALYAKYVKAKEMVGETAGPGAYGKLLKTINSQAPKIMEQYKAKGVDFQIVVKDNQVIIRAKPKT